MKGSFKFVLRGSSDLAYKWIKEKRNSPNQSLNGGVRTPPSASRVCR